MARLKNFKNEPVTSTFKYYKVIDGEALDVQCWHNKYQGERCPKHGTISPNTNGYPPIYCSKHWAERDGIDSANKKKKKTAFVTVEKTVKQIDKKRKFF